MPLHPLVVLLGLSIFKKAAAVSLGYVRALSLAASPLIHLNPIP